jgi:hypothetical protein
MNKLFYKLFHHHTEIKLIFKDEALLLQVNRSPRGLFLYKDGDLWIGIDNRSGDVWTEAFTNRRACERWLKE